VSLPNRYHQVRDVASVSSRRKFPLLCALRSLP